MNLAYINRKIITQAMDARGLMPEQIATSTMTAEKIRSWEQGVSLPTESQAEQLANKLQIPYLVLFLGKLPQSEPVPIPDLRTRSKQPVSHPSREFIEIINDALSRQDWYREHIRLSGKSRLHFIGKFQQNDSIETVAASMRSVLRVNQELRRECHSWEQFLKKLIGRAEASGILVMRSGILRHATKYKLDANEFQGFAISDALAPLVFINDQDTRAAQTFTLAHELAHLWLGQTGISNARLANKTPSELNKAERFCNQVAAEFLVPEKSFTVSWRPSFTTRENLQRISKFFWVSTLVALRRAYDLNKISFEEFQASMKEEYERIRAIEERKRRKEEEKKTKQKGEFWASFKARNSVVFSESVAKELQGGKTTYTQASSLLGVSISTVEKFVRREKAA